MYMKNNIKLSLFIILVVLQLLIPAQMILSRELALRYGQEYKFRVEPADPYDPFSGRYLHINVKDSKVTVGDDREYYSNQVIYVLIENDIDGFARFSGVSQTAPQSGAYIKTKVLYSNYEDFTGFQDKQTIHFQVPFDRYYMPENDAPEAEKLYNEKIAGNNNKEVFVTVKLHRGTAVLDKLYIGDKTIEEYLNQIGNALE